MIDMRIILLWIYLSCFASFVFSCEADLDLYSVEIPIIEKLQTKKLKIFIETACPLVVKCACWLYIIENSIKNAENDFKIEHSTFSKDSNVELLKELPLFEESSIKYYRHQKLQDLAPEFLNVTDLTDQNPSDMLEYVGVDGSTILIRFFKCKYIFYLNHFEMYPAGQFKNLAQNIYRAANRYNNFTFRIYDENGFILQDRTIFLTWRVVHNAPQIQCCFGSNTHRKGFAKKDFSGAIAIVL